MTETLKSCPFCNGEAEIKNNHIECPECIKNFNSIKSKEQLVNFWNTRKSLTLEEIGEVLESGLNQCLVRLLMQKFEKKAEEK